MDQDGTWYRLEVGLGPCHIVLDGDLPPKGHSRPPSFRSMYVCCGQTAGWIKMPLDREVDIGPGDSVLHGDPASQPPIFSLSLVTKRLDG